MLDVSIDVKKDGAAALAQVELYDIVTDSSNRINHKSMRSTFRINCNSSKVLGIQ